MERTPPNSFTPLQHTQYSASDSALNTSVEAINSEYSTNITRRVKRKCETRPEGNNMSNVDQIKELILMSNKKQDEKFETLSVALNSVISQNAEIHKSVDFMAQKYDELLAKLDTVQRENSAYKAHIVTLESKIEVLERNSKVSAVEIKNILKSATEKKESLYGLV